MSKGRQQGQEIPDHWDAKLNQELKKRSMSSVKELCPLGNSYISWKTVVNAFQTRWIIHKSLHNLALLLGYASRFALEDAWNQGEARSQATPGVKPSSPEMPVEIKADLEAAKALTDADKYVDAIPILERAVKSADAVPHAIASVKARLRLAHAVYEAREDYEQAERLYREALTLVPPAEIETKHSAVHGLGDMLLAIGRVDEATAIIASAHELAVESKKTDLIAHSLISQSILHGTCGTRELAMSSLNDALQLLLQKHVTITKEDDKEQNAHTLGICYMNKAMLYQGDGRSVEALEFCEQARSYFVKAKDKLYAGRVLLVAGDLHCQSAEWDKGVHSFQAALHQFGEASHPLWGARALERIARLYGTHDNWEPAVHAILGAVAGAREAGHPMEQVHFLCVAAKILSEFKRESARELVRTALYQSRSKGGLQHDAEQALKMSDQMSEARRLIEETIREDEQVRELLTEAQTIARDNNLHKALANCLLEEVHLLTSHEDERRKILYGQAIESLKHALAAEGLPNRKAELMGRISGLYRTLDNQSETMSWLRCSSHDLI